MMIQVYVPKTYLNTFNINVEDLPKPSEFWLSKPDSWMANDLAVINISPQLWAKWNSGNIQDSYQSRKQLLKD